MIKEGDIVQVLTYEEAERKDELGRPKMGMVGEVMATIDNSSFGFDYRVCFTPVNDTDWCPYHERELRLLERS